jgi:multicomponent Na+:H+ antiporter subunit C
MELVIALLVGFLYASGIYLILRRSLVKLILGLILLGNGANLLIFLVGRLNSEQPPIIPDAASTLTGAYADPIPQALILTAIVISFGLQSFAIVTIKKVYKEVGTDDLDIIDRREQE